MTHTVKQAASILGVAYSTVTYHCRKLQLPKHGPAYVIDDAALAAMRENIQGVPGRPWHKERPGTATDTHQ